MPLSASSIIVVHEIFLHNLLLNINVALLDFPVYANKLVASTGVDGVSVRGGGRACVVGEEEVVCFV